MSEEHMATAREVTRDWTPQTTLADSRRDIANALAAAEERGRRSGFSEGTDAAAKFIETSPDAVHPAVRGWLARDLRALAPRDSAPVCDCGANVHGVACATRKSRDSGKANT